MEVRSQGTSLTRAIWRMLIGMLVLAVLPVSAQVDNVYVYGTVKDHSTAKKLDGVVITVFKNGAKLTEVVTNASGKYEVNLDYGADYKLVYGRSDLVNKNITIDTRNIPEEERLGGHGMNIEMTLFSQLPGVDFSILDNPIGKAKYDGATGEVTWDLEYTNQIRNEIARLMKAYEDRKKREANLEEDFAKLMQAGDEAMGKADFQKAVASFTEALTLKPDEPVAKAKLSDAQMRLTAQEEETRKEEQYAALIKDADGLFNKKEYEAAKGKYEEASKVKPGEAYPKQRIAEIGTILKDLERLAEEERKARELQEKYDAAIKAADDAFKAENYEQARTKYTEASGLKPEEKYPKDQLAAVAAAMEEQARKAEEERLARELQENYDAAIKAADAAFTAKNYEQAQTKYTEASGLKPEEKYPKDQLAAVAAALEELARKAEEERQAKELQARYDAAIQVADAAFNAAKYEDARTKYTEAGEIKPEEKYPKDQLKAIDLALEELARKAEEERQARELQERYDAAIQAADAAFNAADYEDARTKYTEAGEIKPEEKYPKDRLKAIDAALEELARKAEEERLARELQEKYDASIAKADKAFDEERYEQARAAYTEASGLKPEETYPKDRLKAIDERIAELERLAEEERLARELQEKYDAAISAADKAYGSEDWEASKAKYTEAAGLKPAEAYPRDRIAEIDAKLAELARKAEEERKARELQERYDALIVKADAAFKGEAYSEAMNDYRDALQLKPEEAYPQERITAIEGLLDQAARDKAEAERLERERRERDQRYADAVARGDAAFSSEDWNTARSAYTEAGEIKPDEQYPKDRLKAISDRIADQAAADEAARLAAQQAEQDRLAQQAEERDRRYDELVAKGDAAFERDELDLAKAAFKDALGVKPGEQYPQDQLAAIERRRLELSAADEAARLAAEQEAAERARAEEERRRLEADQEALEARYRELIASADLAFGADELERARSSYQQALDVKPGEQYPKDRIANIDAELARRRAQAQDAEAMAAEQRRLEEERRRREQEEADAARRLAEEERMRLEREKELDARYRDLIVEADQALADQQYQQARGTYAQALDVKPAEAYPKAKMEQIDLILAEQERLRREQELAEQRSREEEERRPASTTIDIRKEQEAEQFMREAREREEAEKWERIKKFKVEVSEQEVARTESAAERRDLGLQEKQVYEEGGQQLFQGSEEQRLRNADAIARQKAALADAEQDRRQRNTTERSEAYDVKLNTEQAFAEEQRTWTERQQEQAAALRTEKEEVLEEEADRRAGNEARTRQALEGNDAFRSSLADMQERGDRLVQGRRDEVADEKAMAMAREEQLVRGSEQGRQNAKASLDATPVNKPKSFQDYRQSKLSQEYPPGVTEESYTEGNKVIIRRVVVNGNKADEYSKVIAKWGTFYFKNGQSITEPIWSRETEGQ